MVLVNTTRKTSLSDRCHLADTVFKRMIGLLNRSRFEPGEGLLLDKCYGIHTIGMRFPIDVLLLDQDLRVIRAVKAIPPFRTCVVRKSVYVLELPAGSIERSLTQEGDQVQFSSQPSPTQTSQLKADK